MADRTFIGDFKRNFLTGLAALFPILITIFLLSWLYGRIDKTIGRKVNAVCRTLVVARPSLFSRVFPGAPAEETATAEGREQYAREHFPSFVGVSIGILGALVLVYVAGFMLRTYVGRRVLRKVDGFFEQFPVIKSIYPYARQVADLLFGPRRRSEFRRVVAVQYPRRGLYTVGFLTGGGLKDVDARAGRDLVAVFIPTSPAPVTGFVILAPREEVMDLDMTVEEAFRFSMTGGMVAGTSQRPLHGGGEEGGAWRLSTHGPMQEDVPDLSDGVASDQEPTQ